jgi:hypothetical protein
VRPKGLWRFVFTRLVTVAAIALVMVWALNNTRRGVIEAIVFLGVIALVAAVQVPLFQQRWRHLDERRLESLPSDTIYAGPARAESPPGAVGNRPVPGELVLNGKGVSFIPKRAGELPTSSVTWAEISHIRLQPISAAPLAGALVLTVAGGSKRSFVVQRCQSLADALSQLPERL